MRSTTILLLGVPLSITLMMSCKKEKTDPPSGGGGTATAAQVQYIINGDGFSDQTITVNPMSGSGTALYAVSDDETTGLLMANATNSFQVLFPGNTTGTYTCTGGVGDVGLGLQINGQQYIHYTNSVQVTAYGAVGGWIQGTWSGTVIRSNGPSAGTQATITNGTFRFRRLPDV